MAGDELLGRYNFPILERLKELPPDATRAKWRDDFALTEVTEVSLFIVIDRHPLLPCLNTIAVRAEVADRPVPTEGGYLRQAQDEASSNRDDGNPMDSVHVSGR